MVSRLAERLTPIVFRSWLLATAALVGAGGLTAAGALPAAGLDLGPLAATAPAGDEVAAGGWLTGLSDDEFEGLGAVPYAGLDFVVVDARIVTETSVGNPVAVVDLAVRNRTEATRRVTRGMLNLVDDEGRPVELRRFDYSDELTRLVLDPGETISAVAVFRLPPNRPVETGSYRLHVAEPGRWPAVLPLLASTGDEADNPSAGGDAAAGDIGPRTLGVTALAAETPDGLGFHIVTADSALEVDAYRAPVGRHLAVVTVELKGSVEGTSEPGALDREFWTLADPAQRVAAKAEIIESGSDGTTLRLVFPYPTDASVLTLQAGADTDADPVEMASFEVQPFE